MPKVQHYRTDNAFFSRGDKQPWIVANLRFGDMQWVKNVTPIFYKGYELLALPATEDFYPGLAARLSQRVEGDPPFDTKYAQVVICNFLSAFCWYVREPVEIENFLIGNPPYRSSERQFFVQTSDIHFFDEVPALEEEVQILALALYREALSLNNPAFQFLGFYKIINLLHRNPNSQKDWINKNISDELRKASERVNELKELQVSNIGDYLYKAGRNAVAHATINQWERTANPDNYEDYWRLSKDIPLIKSLAECCIEAEFKIKSRSTLMDEHLYELSGFKAFFNESLLSSINSGAHFDTVDFPWLPRLSIRLRGKERFEALERLKPEIVGVNNGAVYVECSSEDELFQTYLCLNFKVERLQTDFFHKVYILDNGTFEASEKAVQFLKFRKWYLANGILEVWASDYDAILGRCDPFIPTNVIIDLEAADREIKEQEELSKSRKK